MQLNKHMAQAFKKLKSSVFFDKTRPILRAKVTEYEGDAEGGLYQRIAELADILERGNGDAWDSLVERICGSVSVAAYPKHVVEAASATEAGAASEWKFVPNMSMGSPIVDKLQLFIDMDVEGFLLGTLWVMLVGAGLDAGFGDCSYGNRLRKDVGKNGALTWSPYLFEPYFSQYEKWRDGALDIAERTRNEDEKDVVMLTLDFRAFYYSVDLRDADWDRLLKDAMAQSSDDGMGEVRRRLNGLVKAVVEAYSDRLYDNSGDRHNVLPIGFPPSQIISNWCLDRFDREMSDQVNPLFYGRYVDDVIIVDKVERNSWIRERWESGELGADDVFAYLFLNEAGTLFKPKDALSNERGQLESEMAAADEPPRGLPDLSNGGLAVNPEYLNARSSQIAVQGEKVKVFYFDKDAPYALIQQFREEIARSSSAFKLMPNVKSLSLKDSYSLIYDMRRGDSPNKFREVEGIDINSFELSKFLGQAERIGPLLGAESRRARFCEEVLSLLEPSNAIRFYAMWERLFEIAIAFEDDNMLVKLVERIVEAVGKLKVEFDGPSKQCEAIASYASRLGLASPGDGSAQLTLEVRKTLLRALRSYLARSIALLWGSASDRACETAQRLYEGGVGDGVFPAFGAEAWEDDTDGHEGPLSLRDVKRLQRLSCETYMVDKYAMPVLPHFVVPALLGAVDNSDATERRLTRLDDLRELLAASGAGFDPSGGETHGWHLGSIALLFPYIVKANDLEYSYYTWKMETDPSFPSPADVDGFVERGYRILNFLSEDAGSQDPVWEGFVRKMGYGDPRFVVSVPSDRDDLKNIRVALANMELKDKLAEDNLLGRPDLSHGRYSAIARIAEQAKREGANMLVLPELCVPYAWLKKLADFSADNGIAVVCGVEHVTGIPAADGKSRTMNLTAVILPYERESYRFAKLVLHQKVHLAPHERDLIENAGHAPVEGGSFELYHWRGVWFPVYCCFELTSIRERAMFSAYADMLVAVEWNPDTNYFSNIMGSLARDLSCCCIQVNNSRYGDSRVTMPDKTELMDLVKVKGGINSTVLVGSVDIALIRDCQLKLDGGRLKPPAPDFDRKVVRLKVNGALAGGISNGDVS